MYSLIRSLSESNLHIVDTNKRKIIIKNDRRQKHNFIIVCRISERKRTNADYHLVWHRLYCKLANCI